MAGASIKKLVDFIWGEPDGETDGYDDEVYNQEYNEDYESEEQEPEQESGWKFNIKKRNKVVSMPQPQQIKMKIAKPTNFDQAREIIAQYYCLSPPTFVVVVIKLFIFLYYSANKRALFIILIQLYIPTHCHINRQRSAFS